MFGLNLRTLILLSLQWYHPSVSTLPTLSPEGLSTQVTLVRSFTAVDPQMHVEVVLLGERMATQVAHKGSLISWEAGQTPLVMIS